MKNEEILERIETRLAEIGMTERSASMAAVGTPDLIRMMRVRGTSPRLESAKALADVMGVSLNWLVGSDNATDTPPALHLVGEPVKVSGPAPRPSTAFCVPEIDVRAGMGGGGEVAVDYWYDDDGNGFQTDSIKNQDWTLPSEYIRLNLSTPPEAARIIEVQGDSMSPTFETGDRVMINTADTRPSPPGIFAINDGMGLVVKRVEFIPHSDPLTCRISSDNKHHVSYERSAEELQIIGRVVWYGRRV